jgi:SAM-dependent methyltransferase
VLNAAAHPAMTARPPNHGAMDRGVLPSDIRLRCPRCATAILQADCPACSFSITVRCGIARALAPESQARLSGFIDEYERIREAEGRGSESGDFYLGLPYRDSSGRDPGQWHVRARSHDYAMRNLLSEKACRPMGMVLDLGAGNCWMSYRLALAGYRPCAVDLLTNDSDGMGAARHYRTRLPALFPRFQASFGQLPFVDDQFDAAVFNASFQYSEDGEASLRESLRCVRPGGMVIISDTPWYPRPEDGSRMVAERRAAFLGRHGTAGDSLAMLDFLTDEWLQRMQRALSIQWEIHRPWYGLAWAMRPVVATLRGRRRPSRFRLYVARKRA